MVYPKGRCLFLNVQKQPAQETQLIKSDQVKHVLFKLIDLMWLTYCNTKKPQTNLITDSFKCFQPTMTVYQHLLIQHVYLHLINHIHYHFPVSLKTLRKKVILTSTDFSKCLQNLKKKKKSTNVKYTLQNSLLSELQMIL